MNRLRNFVSRPCSYRGYDYDEESGFYYLQSRYYDPTVGRFISGDEVDYLGARGLISTNLYAYCENNAVNNSDPFGCAPFLGWGIQLEGYFMGASYYTMIPSNVIISIANGFSTLLKKIKQITNLI